jgi:hypothetical protein
MDTLEIFRNVSSPPALSFGWQACNIIIFAHCALRIEAPDQHALLHPAMAKT